MASSTRALLRDRLAGVAILCLAAGAVVATPAAAEKLPVRATVVQLSADNAAWTLDRWQELFQRFRDLELEEVIVQWSVAGETAFYPSAVASGPTWPVLEGVLDLAHAAGMRVTVGLVHDPEFESKIRRDVALVEIYLRRLELRSRAVAEEVARRLGGRPAFAGWYLPQEIDDVHWLEPERRAVLAAYLANLGRFLDELTPGAAISISGFSNSHAEPDKLEALWRDLLEAAPIDRVLFQDGVGAGKQLLEDVSLYLAAVERAVSGASRELQVVVELFEQVGGPPLDEGPFEAVPAPVERVQRQLLVASRHAPDGLVLFTAADYLDPRRGEAADLLRQAFVAAIWSQGRIAGTVLEATSGEPAARAHLQLLDEGGAAVREGRSGEDGSFALEDLQAGTYRLRARRSADPGAAEGESRITLAGGEDVTAVEITLAVPSSEGELAPTRPAAGAAGQQDPIYELQLGLYHFRSPAAAFVKALAARDLDAYIHEVTSSRGETRYTVRLGPFGSMAEAAARAASLRAEEDLEAVIRFRIVRR